jgi:hypothetical protein
MVVLQLGFQLDERRDLAFGELVDPSVVDLPDWDRVEEVQLFSARPTADHEPRLFEHPQVLHHPKAGHSHLGLKLAQSAAVTLEQQIQNVPSGRVSERFKHPVTGHLLEDR